MPCRLAEICESRLAAELMDLEPKLGAEEAPSLLRLADELGLQQLKRVAVAYVAKHYSRVRQAGSFQDLTRDDVDAVAAELADDLAKLKGVLKDLQPPADAPPPRRPFWW